MRLALQTEHYQRFHGLLMRINLHSGAWKNFIKFSNALTVFDKFGSPNFIVASEQFVVDDFSDGVKYLISMDNMEVKKLNMFGEINGWLIVQ